MIKSVFFAILCLLIMSALKAQQQGKYFSKKQYVETALPVFAELRSKLPAPIFDEDSSMVKGYWKAWELAFRNFYSPTPDNGFVSQYIDAAFNANSFLWDGCFMTMFCNFASPLVPGIGTLDNFYAKQHESGEICREIVRATGKDYAPWVNSEKKALFSRFGNQYEGKSWEVKYLQRTIPEPPPVLTLDALNHPILAWAELESFRVTGDRERLKSVFAALQMYYHALQKYLRQGNGLYVTDWAGMDNSTRNEFIEGGGTAVDISAEMVLFARNLSEIAALLHKAAESKRYRAEAESLSVVINNRMWNPAKAFYYDLSLDGKFAPVKTIGAFWTLLAQVATKEQAEQLAAELQNPATFGRQHRVPTLAADQLHFDPLGGYWRGSVWASTNTMVIRGLEKYGYDSLAEELAMNHLRNVSRVFEKTGTFWENYAADSLAPGNQAKSDFVGWSGIAPIMYFIEYAIGLKPDAGKNELYWNIRSQKRSGVKNFRFNKHLVSLTAVPGTRRLDIRVISDGPFLLKARYKRKLREFRIHSGSNDIIF